MVISEKDFEKLDYSRQVVFAYITCERLYPNYVFFSNKCNYGNAKVLRDCIDYVYKNLFFDKFNQTSIESLVLAIEDIIPEPADFDTVLASSAMDACTTIIETLHFLLDRKTSRLCDISTFAIDTVDMYIQELEKLNYNTDKNFQIKINNHPLMQKEIRIQKGVVTYLQNSKNINSDDIQILIRLQESDKNGSLNL